MDDVINNHDVIAEHAKEESSGSKSDHQGMIWGLTDNPPWYECILLGFQHFLALYITSLSIPLVLAKCICMEGDTVALTELFATHVFISGIGTLLQVLLGVRLPIVQVNTVSLLVPVISYYSIPSLACPLVVRAQEKDTLLSNSSTVVIGSPEHQALWKGRLVEMQGSLMVATTLEIVLGCLGVMGFLLRYIGPLSIAPTIGLLGLSLFRVAANEAAKHWWIALFTLFVMVVFSQFLGRLQVPCPVYSKKRGWRRTTYPMFQMYSVLLSIIVAWMLCFVLTAAGVFPNDPNRWGYDARTDVKSYAIFSSPWFRLPYPGQWGPPCLAPALIPGLMTGLMASIVESLGDYHACAKVAGVPAPPTFAINRGILMEGVASFIAAVFGTGNAVTSNSVNIGIIGLTRVSSRRVIVVSGVMSLIFGVLCKFGSILVTVPDPVIGAIFFLFFGMIVAVGISSLESVNMKSPRNQFIFGLSFFFGLALPDWVNSHPDAIHTGSEVVDNIIVVLLGTNMFIGGFMGFVLDNTIPGTTEERGIKKATLATDTTNESASPQYDELYSIPYIDTRVRQFTWTRFIPLCPPPMRKMIPNASEEDSVL